MRTANTNPFIFSWCRCVDGDESAAPSTPSLSNNFDALIQGGNFGGHSQSSSGDDVDGTNGWFSAFGGIGL